MRSSGAPVSVAAGCPRRYAPRRPLNANVRSRMNRLRGRASFAVIAVLVCCAEIGEAQVPSGHPLIGKWQWTREQNNCTEMYEFRADGTVPVVSGTERTDNTYTVA